METGGGPSRLSFIFDMHGGVVDIETMIFANDPQTRSASVGTAEEIGVKGVIKSLLLFYGRTVVFLILFGYNDTI